jgi:hypothetical protein
MVGTLWGWWHCGGMVMVVVVAWCVWVKDDEWVYECELVCEW